MREYTWWRRFHSVQRIPKEYLYKGASELLQRIEFGEFECDHLGREVYLEDKIYEFKEQKLLEEKPWLQGESLREAMEYDRRLYKKRQNTMLKKHYEIEDGLLYKLAEALAKDFEFEIDYVKEVMETFDGTTRQLWFYLLCQKTNREYSHEWVDSIPRLFKEQPRHVLKPKERKYAKLWIELIKERGWQHFLNWQ
jgi:hypothetical protein